MHPVVRTLVNVLRETRPIIMRPLQKFSDPGLSMNERYERVQRTRTTISIAIKDALKRAYPETNIVFLPLRDPIPENESCFVIQALDGGFNYARALPEFTSAISFVEKGAVKHTAIMVPMANEYFSATAHEGAQWNERRIRICQTSLEDDITLALFNDGERESAGNLYQKLNLQNNINIRINNSPILHFCNLVIGAIDSVITLNVDTPENLFPAKLILRESGGVFTNLITSSTLNKNNYIAGTPETVKYLSKFISS